jgi:hypothetical protein
MIKHDKDDGEQEKKKQKVEEEAKNMLSTCRMPVTVTVACTR